MNEVGSGGLATQSLEVLAPPTFIESLKPYTGKEGAQQVGGERMNKKKI